MNASGQSKAIAIIPATLTIPTTTDNTDFNADIVRFLNSGASRTDWCFT